MNANEATLLGHIWRLNKRHMKEAAYAYGASSHEATFPQGVKFSKFAELAEFDNGMDLTEVADALHNLIVGGYVRQRNNGDHYLFWHTERASQFLELLQMNELTKNAMVCPICQKMFLVDKPVAGDEEMEDIFCGECCAKL